MEYSSYDRQDYIDIFRGLGIVLMIMGHVEFGDMFNHFIHAFHMPMFFVISGFFFKSANEVSLKAFVRKKADSLLVPYFMFGVFHFFLYLLTSKEKSVEPLLHLFWENTEELPIAGALWFLTSLFWGNLIYFWIDRYIINEIYKWIVVIVIVIFGNFEKIILPFPLPYALGASMVGVGLIHVGYTVHKKKSNRGIAMVFNMGWARWIISAIFVTALIFMNGSVNMRTGDYAFIPLFWINSIGAVIVGMNFSRLISRRIDNSFIHNWLCSIGRNSIVYVCLNQIVILILKKCCTVLSIPIVGTKVLILILTLFILSLCSLIIIGSRLRILIGKGTSSRE